MTISTEWRIDAAVNFYLPRLRWARFSLILFARQISSADRHVCVCVHAPLFFVCALHQLKKETERATPMYHSLENKLRPKKIAWCSLFKSKGSENLNNKIDTPMICICRQVSIYRLFRFEIIGIRSISTLSKRNLYEITSLSITTVTLWVLALCPSFFCCNDNCMLWICKHFAKSNSFLLFPMYFGMRGRNPKEVEKRAIIFTKLAFHLGR